MPLQCDQSIAAKRIPQSCGLVVGGGKNTLTVRAESSTPKPVPMPFKNGQDAAIVYVPQYRRFVESGSDYFFTIGTERNILNHLLMLLQDSQGRTAVHIP